MIPKSEIEKEFIEAYDTFSGAIFRHCLFKVSDREVAKDITQEVFTKVWKYIASGNKVVNMKAFIYRVANNQVVDEYRKKKGISLDYIIENGFDVSTGEEKHICDIFDGKEAVRNLDKVNPKYQQVITMRYVDGLSPKEIAVILNETENNISVRINRGIKKAREILHGSEKATEENREKNRKNKHLRGA